MSHGVLCNMALQQDCLIAAHATTGMAGIACPLHTCRSGLTSAIAVISAKTHAQGEVTSSILALDNTHSGRCVGRIYVLRVPLTAASTAAYSCLTGVHLHFAGLLKSADRFVGDADTG